MLPLFRAVAKFCTTKRLFKYLNVKNSEEKEIMKKRFGKLSSTGGLTETLGYLMNSARFGPLANFPSK